MKKTNSKVKPKVKVKQVKEDLIGIALVHLAKESSKKAQTYVDALLDHVSEKSKKIRDEAENWVWDIVYEELPYERFKEEVSKFKKRNGSR